MRVFGRTHFFFTVLTSCVSRFAQASLSQWSFHGLYKHRVWIKSHCNYIQINRSMNHDCMCIELRLFFVYRLYGTSGSQKNICFFFFVHAFWDDLHMSLFGLNFVYKRIPYYFMLELYWNDSHATIILNVHTLQMLSGENERTFDKCWWMHVRMNGDFYENSSNGYFQFDSIFTDQNVLCSKIISWINKCT